MDNDNLIHNKMEYYPAIKNEIMTGLDGDKKQCFSVR